MVSELTFTLDFNTLALGMTLLVQKSGLRDVICQTQSNYLMFLLLIYKKTATLTEGSFKCHC